MLRIEEFHQMVNEASSWAERVQTLVAKMTAEHEPTPDDYGAARLSTSLEMAIDYLRTAHEMASYLSRPVKETSRLWKNGSGQYETTSGFCFRAGSPIEVFIPDEYRPGGSHWERTYLRHDGRDYYLASQTDIPLKGLAVRVREGDQPEYCIQSYQG